MGTQMRQCGAHHPQIGAAVLALQDRSKIDDETAPSACSFTGSVQFALVYKKLCISVTPEYYVPVAKSDGMKELVKVSTHTTRH